MKLEQLKAETCPTCGSGTVAEACRRRHTSGAGYEEREFACGCVIEWNAFFSRVRTKRQCPKAPMDPRQAARYAMLDMLIAAAKQDRSTDKDWRESLVTHLEHARYFLYVKLPIQPSTSVNPVVDLDAPIALESPATAAGLRDEELKNR